MHGTNRQTPEKKTDQMNAAEPGAETAMQESERRYRALIDNFPNGAVVMFDKDLRYTVAGGQILPKLGLRAEEMIGKTAREVLMPSAYEQIEPNYRTALQGTPVWFEIAYQKRTFKFHALPIKDCDGNIVGGMSMSQDVTDQKEAIEQLLSSELKFRSMMEALTDLIYICSHDRKVEYMNPAMVKRVGRNGIGQLCHKVLHGLSTPCHGCVQNDVLQGKTVELNVTSPRDNRTFRVTNIPMHNQDGTVSKMAIFRDITDYVNAMKENERATIRLQQAQKMESIGTLAGGIAHDFNNILSSILGFTELALDDVAPGTMLEDNLQEVYIAGRRAKELVKQILTFARQTDEEIKPVRIDTIVKEALKLIRASTPTTIEIRQRIQSKALTLANTTQVHQIVMNLCTNALHAMEAHGGVMTIELRDVVLDYGITPGIKHVEPGNYVQLSVSDTGVGIAADMIDFVFEPYFTTKEPGEGTGMGLSVVHGIVKSYQGEIDVTSTPGQGTCFTLFLPATKKSAPSDVYQTDVQAGGSERILFVDDELPIVRMGSQTLSRLGYQVTERTSSLEALNLFQSKPGHFDLVITDMTMPNMSGDELAKTLLAIRPDIPIILLTGYSKRVDEGAMAAIGVKAFAFKPIIRKELAAMVRDVLDGAIPVHKKSPA